MPRDDTFRSDGPAIRAWPERIPADLRLRMLDVLSYRSVSPDDVWDELRDWLEANMVVVPPNLPGGAGRPKVRKPRLAGEHAPWSY